MVSARRWAVLGVAMALAATACSSSSTDGAAAKPAEAQAVDGPCPANLVIQTDWFAEIEHGGVYQLIGPGGSADKERFTYSGPLLPQYRGSHGVQTVEIRSGGAAIGTTVLDAMNADDSIYLGFVNTDDIIAARGSKSSFTSVMSTLDINPQMLMWNPTRYSILDFKDLARTRAKVLYFKGSTYIDYLVSKGYLRPDQLDDSYDGSPTRWLESDGDVIQQGFASNEVFTYEEAMPEWQRPVDFFLIHWLGYEVYPETLTMQTAELAEQRNCLKLLVPTMQRAWVDFLTEPDPVSQTVVSTLEAYDSFFKVSPALNSRAIDLFKQYEIASNGSDDTLGNFDEARVDRMITIVSDIFAARGQQLPKGLKAADVVTNEFVDPAIRLPDGWDKSARELNPVRRGAPRRVSGPRRHAGSALGVRYGAR